MYFALLIHSDEDLMGAAPPEELAAIGPAVDAFDRALSEAGSNVGSVRLGGTAATTVIRVRGGRVMTTDGPFAETKEQLGGLYLLDVADRATALALAAELPMAAFGAVEVRELAGLDLRRTVSPEA